MNAIYRPAAANNVTTRGANNFTTTITNAAQSRPGQQFYQLQGK